MESDSDGGETSEEDEERAQSLQKRVPDAVRNMVSTVNVHFYSH